MLPAPAASEAGVTLSIASQGDGVFGAILRVRQIRGWPPIAVPQVVTGNEVTLRAWLRHEFEAQMPTRAADAQDRAMALLGIVPEGFQSNAELVGAFARSIAGAYLPTRKVVIVREGLRPDVIAAAFHHELVHLFQDRLYDLGDLIAYRPRRGDAISTYHSLAEGEATHIEVEIQRRAGVAITDEAILARFANPSSEFDLPKVMRRALLAAYGDGYQFVTYLRRLGGWALVDAVWKRGLENSAELLHPERWIGQSGRLTPRAKDGHAILSASASAWLKDSELVFEDSLGEQAVRVLLEEFEAPAVAARTAAEWEHDAIALLRSRTEEFVVWHLRARSLGGAFDLARGLEKSLGIDLGAVQGCRVSGHRALVLLTRGQDIVVVASGMSDTMSAGHRGNSCRRLLGRAAAVMATIM